MSKIHQKNTANFGNFYRMPNENLSNKSQSSSANITPKKTEFIQSIGSKFTYYAFFLGRTIKSIGQYLVKLITMPFTFIVFMANKLTSRKINAISNQEIVFVNSYIGASNHVGINSICDMVDFDLDLSNDITEEKKFGFNVIKQDYLKDDADAKKILEFVYNLKLNYGKQKYFSEIKDECSTKLIQYFQNNMGPTIIDASNMFDFAKKYAKSKIKNLSGIQLKNAKMSATDIFTNLIFYMRYKKEYDKQISNDAKKHVKIDEVIDKAGQDTKKIVKEILKIGITTEDYRVAANWLSSNNMIKFDSIETLKTALTADKDENSGISMPTPKQRKQVKDFILYAILYAISKNKSINSYDDLFIRLRDLT